MGLSSTPDAQEDLEFGICRHARGTPPESWRVKPNSEGCCQSQNRRTGLVKDFALWTECYATLVAVLAVYIIQKFLAYLCTFMHASRNLEGTAWATYDMAYRWQAVNLGSLYLATIDPALYNEAFTGLAKSVSLCQHCLADTRHRSACLLHMSAGGSQQNQDCNHAIKAVKICRLFNKLAGNQCKYKFCRYTCV